MAVGELGDFDRGGIAPDFSIPVVLTGADPHLSAPSLGCPGAGGPLSRWPPFVAIDEDGDRGLEPVEQVDDALQAVLNAPDAGLETDLDAIELGSVGLKIPLEIGERCAIRAACTATAVRARRKERTLIAMLHTPATRPI